MALSPTGLSYKQLAARDGHPYMVRVIVEKIGHCASFGTLDEAMDYAMDAEHAELLAIDEPIPNEVIETRLASVLFGEWYIHDTTELTMAKVKEVKKNGAKMAKEAKSKAALDELLGSPKKGVKGAKPVKGKTDKAPKERASRATYENSQKIKVLKKYDKEPRDGSNLALSLGVMKPGITIGDWNKARAKAGVENVGFGYLNMLVKGGYVKVV
jgi:hypothetical protein